MQSPKKEEKKSNRGKRGPYKKKGKSIADSKKSVTNKEEGEENDTNQVLSELTESPKQKRARNGKKSAPAKTAI